MAPKKISNDPKRRSKRIKTLIQRLKDDCHVQNRDIEAVLMVSEQDAFRRELAAIRDSERHPHAYPDELDSYLRLLEEADLAAARAERWKGRAASARRQMSLRLIEEPMGLYEHAMERLTEIWQTANNAQRAAIEYWLDRPLQFTEMGNVEWPGLDGASAHRIRGSKSRYANRELVDPPTLHDKRRDAKIRHLDGALLSLDANEHTKKATTLNVAFLNDLRKTVRR